jgi:hypothetical protein
MIVKFLKYLWSIVTGGARFENKGDTPCLCIGMQNSSKYGSCPGAYLDSTRMHRLLSKYGASECLGDKTATVAAVKAAMQEACKKNLAIIFYSGHGGRVANPKAQDGSGYSEHLCLNNGALFDYTIWDIVSKAAGRVVLIFDCCHSATMYRSSAKYNSYKFNQGFEFSMLKNMAFAQGKNNILVWSGCPSDNYSYGDGNGGVLTNAILNSYAEGRTYDEVWRRASKKAYEQRPVRTVIGEGFDGKVFR